MGGLRKSVHGKKGEVRQSAAVAQVASKAPPSSYDKLVKKERPYDNSARQCRAAARPPPCPA